MGKRVASVTRYLVGGCLVICDDHEGVWVASGSLLLCISIVSASLLALFMPVMLAYDVIMLCVVLMTKTFDVMTVNAIAAVR